MKKGIMDIALFYGKPSDRAIIHPSDWIDHIKQLKGIDAIKIPRYCTLGFFKDTYDLIRERYQPKIMNFISDDHPIYVFDYENLEVAFVYSAAGSPYAGLLLETMIGLGTEYILFFGGVGTLTSEIERGKIIIPNKAIRDEGTSFHYEKPSRYSYPSKTMLKFIKQSLKKNGVPFEEGGTWTTDAPFRETMRKVKTFRDEGCLAVDMEASALFSIAKFRKKRLGGLFIAQDCVAGKKWDSRMKKEDIEKIRKERRRLLDYVLDAFFLLNEQIRKEESKE